MKYDYIYEIFICYEWSSVSVLHHLNQSSIIMPSISQFDKFVKKKVYIITIHNNIIWTIGKYVGCKLLLLSYVIILTHSNLIAKLSRGISYIYISTYSNSCYFCRYEYSSCIERFRIGYSDIGKTLCCETQWKGNVLNADYSDEVLLSSSPFSLKIDIENLVC